MLLCALPGLDDPPTDFLKAVLFFMLCAHSTRMANPDVSECAELLPFAVSISALSAQLADTISHQRAKSQVPHLTVCVTPCTQD